MAVRAVKIAAGKEEHATDLPGIIDQGTLLNAPKKHGSP
jgi:hypothetical protein